MQRGILDEIFAVHILVSLGLQGVKGEEHKKSQT